MNFNKKKSQLINLIELFLKGKISTTDLQNYAWNTIDDFSPEKWKKSVVANQDENIFWFTIWQIQHLADEDHLKDGTLRRELKLTLNYLLNKIPIPKKIIGKPPI
jgi:hypothetical protein